MGRLTGGTPEHPGVGSTLSRFVGNRAYLGGTEA